MSKKKRIILVSVLSAVVIIMIALPIIIISINKHKKRYDLDGLSIVNFKNLTAIGAGQIDSSGISSVAQGVKDKSEKQNTKLIGYNKDGHCEEISFEDEKGNKKSQKANLIHFDYYENFSFAVYSTDVSIVNQFIEIENCIYKFRRTSTTKNEYDLCIENKKDYLENFYANLRYVKFFIIDNNTGKIYDIEKILNKLFEGKEVFAEVSLMNICNGVMLYDYESLLLKVKVDANTSSINNAKTSVYQLDFYSDRAEVKERIGEVQYSNFAENNGTYNTEGVYPDRFGNIVSFYGSTSGTEREIKYQTKDGKFKTFYTTEAKMSFNGILYIRSGTTTKYLNENGELIEIGFDEELFSVIEYQQQTEDTAIYRDGNVMYLYYSSYPDYNHAVKKITLDESVVWKYTIEIVKFDDSDGYVGQNNTTRLARGNLFYELREQKITCYDLSTGESSQFESIYKFKNLKYNKNLDRITFKAVDQNTMLEVDGYLDENNKIVLGDFRDVDNNISKIYVIKPIN